MWSLWGRGEVCTGFWWGNVRERNHCGDLDPDGRIILRWIFSKWDVGVWIGSSWLRIGTGVGRYDYGNKPSGSIKRGEFLD